MSRSFHAETPYVLGYKVERHCFTRAFAASPSLKTWSIESAAALPAEFRYIGKSQLEKLIHEDRKEFFTVKKGLNKMALVSSCEDDNEAPLLLHKGGVLGKTTGRDIVLRSWDHSRGTDTETSRESHYSCIDVGGPLSFVQTLSAGNKEEPSFVCSSGKQFHTFAVLRDPGFISQERAQKITASGIVNARVRRKDGALQKDSWEDILLDKTQPPFSLEHKESFELKEPIVAIASNPHLPHQCAAALPKGKVVVWNIADSIVGTHTLCDPALGGDAGFGVDLVEYGSHPCHLWCVRENSSHIHACDVRMRSSTLKNRPFFDLPGEHERFYSLKRSTSASGEWNCVACTETRVIHVDPRYPKRSTREFPHFCWSPPLFTDSFTSIFKPKSKRLQAFVFCDPLLRKTHCMLHSEGPKCAGVDSFRSLSCSVPRVLDQTKTESFGVSIPCRTRIPIDDAPVHIDGFATSFLKHDNKLDIHLAHMCTSGDIFCQKISVTVDDDDTADAGRGVVVSELPLPTHASMRSDHALGNVACYLENDRDSLVPHTLIDVRDIQEGVDVLFGRNTTVGVGESTDNGGFGLGYKRKREEALEKTLCLAKASALQNQVEPPWRGIAEMQTLDELNRSQGGTQETLSAIGPVLHMDQKPWQTMDLDLCTWKANASSEERTTAQTQSASSTSSKISDVGNGRCIHFIVGRCPMCLAEANSEAVFEFLSKPTDWTAFEKTACKFSHAEVELEVGGARKIYGVDRYEELYGVLEDSWKDEQPSFNQGD
jgi:hypothetical protein